MEKGMQTLKSLSRVLVVLLSIGVEVDSKILRAQTHAACDDAKQEPTRSVTY